MALIGKSKEEDDGEERSSEEAARDALLEAITKAAGKAKDAQELLHLAEAFAWVVEPEEEHG